MHHPIFEPYRPPTHDDMAGTKLVFRAPDDCCSPRAPAGPPAQRRRARLAELTAHVHCSVIGTCLSDAELRRLVPRFSSVDPRRASELDVHHAAVELSSAGGPACKALNKALDERYAMAIRRFGAVRTEDGLRDLWRESLAAGDVPGAYWAVLTHPDVTPELRQLVFGEVHMLSHLVGASNRADIRRLVALETENAALKDKVARQQRRLMEMSVDRGRAHEELRSRLIDEQAQRDPALADGAAHDQVRALQDKLSESEQRLLKQQSHGAAMDERAAAAEREADGLRSELERAQALLAGVRAENEALERVVSGRMVPGAGEPSGADVLRGRKIVYVGGRPSTHQAIRQVVEAADGDIAIHDGGIEDRKGLLSSAIAHADIVAFPVDCIDHDSAQRLKRQCDRLGVAWYPLRTASVGSFVTLAERLAQEQRTKMHRE